MTDDDPDVGPERLVLRPLYPGDERTATAAHRELEADRFEFLLGWHPGLDWRSYLDRLDAERIGTDLAEDRVPATFLVAEMDGELVGRVSIRHRLNDWLEGYGGHIGYGVRPAWRGCGIATTMLDRSLVLAAELVEGDQVLLTCDDDNLASASVIERCGGVLEDRRRDPLDDVLKRRYWIKLPQRS